MTLVKNKKAYFDYEIIREYEAGIELLGLEVKSIKKGMISLKGSFVIIEKGEVFLKNAHITAYQEKNTPENYNTERNRRLLLNKQEIEQIIDAKSQKGLTVIPLSMYNKGGKIKVKIATAKGKKKYDKRQNIKEKDEKRKIDKELKSSRF